MNLLPQAEFTPFPRPPVRPNGYFKGFLPKANSWQRRSGPGDGAEDYYDKRENVNDKYRGRVESIVAAALPPAEVVQRAVQRR